MPTKQFRTIVDALNIRSAPRNGDDTKTGLQLKFGDLITVETDTRVEAEGSLWIKHERGWSVERPLDGRAMYLTDAVTPREKLFGINIDPNNPKATASADRLYGVGWVRFVFHVESRRETVEQAFAFFDPVIRAYSQAGVKILLILLQDTFGGNAPWLGNNDWRQFARGFGERAGVIARRYRGQVAAYQVWNEGDVSGAPTSIFVRPEDYAAILLATAQAISQADPAALVVTGGLASPTDNAIEYLKAVRTASGGIIPADGIAVHPYGQIPPDPSAEPFPLWNTGSIKRTLQKFSDNFPAMPVWITEFGVPRVDVANREYWGPIANYMGKTVSYLRQQFHHQLAAIIWFAWGDDMDRAGITDYEQRPKGAQYTQFFQSTFADTPTLTRTVTPFDNKLMAAQLSADLLTESTIGSVASRLGNVGFTSLLMRTSAGTSWQGRTDLKKTLAISSPSDLARWASELARVRCELHAWHQVQARSVVEITNELNLITQIAVSPGVNAVVLDLDMSFGPKNSTAIRNFMVPLRRNLPQPYHIALSFEATPTFFQNVTLSDWFPFINSWHPRVTLSTAGGQNPLVLLNAACNALRPFRKPIIPMFKIETSGAASSATLRLAARFAFDSHGCQGLSFWHLGTLGTPEYDAMKSLSVPYLAGTSTRPPLGAMTVQAGSPLRVRTVPNTNGDILGQLIPGQTVNIIEKRILGGIEWVRHETGWSAARNTSTGEAYLV